MLDFFLLSIIAFWINKFFINFCKFFKKNKKLGVDIKFWLGNMEDVGEETAECSEGRKPRLCKTAVENSIDLSDENEVEYSLSWAQT